MNDTKAQACPKYFKSKCTPEGCYIRFWLDLLALGVDLFSIMDVDMTPEVAMLTGRDRLEGWDLIRTPELSVLMAEGGLEAEWYVLSRLKPGGSRLGEEGAKRKRHTNSLILEAWKSTAHEKEQKLNWFVFLLWIFKVSIRRIKWFPFDSIRYF